MKRWLGLSWGARDGYIERSFNKLLSRARSVIKGATDFLRKPVGSDLRQLTRQFWSGRGVDACLRQRSAGPVREVCDLQFQGSFFVAHFAHLPHASMRRGGSGSGEARIR